MLREFFLFRFLSADQKDSKLYVRFVHPYSAEDSLLHLDTKVVVELGPSKVNTSRQVEADPAVFLTGIRIPVRIGPLTVGKDPAFFMRILNNTTIVADFSMTYPTLGLFRFEASLVNENDVRF